MSDKNEKTPISVDIDSDVNDEVKIYQIRNKIKKKDDAVNKLLKEGLNK